MDVHLLVVLPLQYHQDWMPVLVERIMVPVTKRSRILSLPMMGLGLMALFNFYNICDKSKNCCGVNSSGRAVSGIPSRSQAVSRLL